MHKSEEIALAREAVARGWIKAQDLALCLKAQRENTAETPLTDILIDRSLVNEEQIKILIQEQDSANSQTTDSGVFHQVDSSPDQIQTFGRYQIIREIGRGGMGKVYLAKDPHLQREVALKVLMTYDDETERGRFFREAKAMATLKHPGIVSVYDIGVEDERPFFTMDYIDGKSLKEVVEEETLSVEEIYQILEQILQAMKYAHNNEIIHRDLKPANIMISHDRQVRIMDFGLAKFLEDSQELSRSGVLLGTLLYMPPEQVNGYIKQIDKRSDIYSIGAVLYEMICKEPPFTGESFAAVIRKIEGSTPNFGEQVKKVTPAGMRQLCLKALSKKQQNRHQSCEEFLTDLMKVRAGQSIATSRSKGKTQKRNKNASRSKSPSLVSKLFPIVATAIVCFVIFSFMLPKDSDSSTPDSDQSTNQEVATKDNDSNSQENQAKNEALIKEEMAAKHYSPPSGGSSWQRWQELENFPAEYANTKIGQKVQNERVTLSKEVGNKLKIQLSKIHQADYQPLNPTAIAVLETISQQDSNVLSDLKLYQQQNKLLHQYKEAISSKSSPVETWLTLWKLLPDTIEKPVEKIILEECQKREEAFLEELTTVQKLIQTTSGEKTLQSLEENFWWQTTVLEGIPTDSGFGQEWRKIQDTKINLEQEVAKISKQRQERQKKVAKYLTDIIGKIKSRDITRSIQTLKKMLRYKKEYPQDLVKNLEGAYQDFIDIEDFFRRVATTLKNKSGQKIILGTIDSKIVQGRISGLQGRSVVLKTSAGKKALPIYLIRANYCDQVLSKAKKHKKNNKVLAILHHSEGNTKKSSHYLEKNSLPITVLSIQNPISNKTSRPKTQQSKKMPEHWNSDLWNQSWQAKEQYLDFTTEAWDQMPYAQQGTLAQSYQKWYAKKIRSKTSKSLRFKGVSYEFVLIPPGKYWQGAKNKERSQKTEEIRHKTLISKPFWMGAHEVSQAQWLTVEKENPSRFQGNPDLPVEEVSWEEATDFCKKLNFRLPTEAEWEYACRAGTTTVFYCGDDIFLKQANFNGEAYDESRPSEVGPDATTPVGKHSPNPWGAYDFHGNIEEWCQDWFAPYTSLDQVDPIGPPQGSKKIYRGGNYSKSASKLRSSCRRWEVPSAGKKGKGFRVVLIQRP